jgi:hypothetical protein
MKSSIRVILKSLLIMSLFAGPMGLRAQGTAFTYQGMLNAGGIPASGNYDLTFQLFNALSNGAPVGPIVTNSATAVSNGLFAVTLDFGAGIFTGSNYWVKISARTNGSGVFTNLIPLLPLTPTPYAINAATATALSGSLSNASLTGTYSNAVTFNNPGNSFTGNGAGLSNVTAANLSGIVSNGSLTGTYSNALIFNSPSNSFTGNGAGLSNVTAANLSGIVSNGSLIGTYSNALIFNSPSNSFTGNGAGLSNVIAANLGGIVSNGSLIGTYSNTLIFNSPSNSFTGNGTGISNVNAVTVGGVSASNLWQLSGNAGTTPGTQFLGTTDSNALEFHVNGARALRLEPASNGFPNIIGGSSNNSVTAGVFAATIAGGGLNTIQSNALYSTIGGGVSNIIQTNAHDAVIPGGSNNLAAGNFSFAAGQQARALHQGAFVWADSSNAPFASTTNDQFLIRAAGGVGINTNNAGGAALNINGAVVATSFSGSGAGLSVAASNIIGTVSLAQLPGGVLTNNESGVVLTGVFTGDGTALSNVNAATVGGLNPTNFWALNGNAGTTPGTQFLGTSDNNALELHVNNIRALRLEPNANGPNVIGGYGGNSVTTGAYGATIAGGGGSSGQNTVNGNYTTIGGGYQNSGNGQGSTISGGGGNDTSGNYATVVGGQGNFAAEYTTVSGGQDNFGGGQYATVGGGQINQNFGTYSTIGGGQNNFGGGIGSTVAGGQNNFSEGTDSTIAGGADNESGNNYSTVGGGQGNEIYDNGNYATISGGYQNIGNATGAFIGGGGTDGTNFLGNLITGAAAVVVGGMGNTNNGNYAMIGGGYQNTIQAGAQYAVIPGGSNNLAAGNYSFAAGQQAQALHAGAFVWADSQNAAFASTANDQFRVRVRNGAIFTDGNGNSASWTPGSGSWNFSSDRNLKDRFAPVNEASVLDKVARLPLAEWSYKGHEQRHIGAMAQDFHALFPLNADDKVLNEVDLHGVELAAIKGLNQKLEAQANDLKAKDAAIQALEERLQRLESIMSHSSGE